MSVDFCGSRHEKRTRLTTRSGRHLLCMGCPQESPVVAAPPRTVLRRRSRTSQLEMVERFEITVDTTRADKYLMN